MISFRERLSGSGLFAIAFLLGLLFSCAFAASAGTVSGSVRNSSGLPLSGITVQAYASSETLASQTVSSTSGSWSLSLATGTFRFLSFDSAGGYATDFYNRSESFATSSEVSLAECAALSGIDFVLAPAATLTGLVRDAQTLQVVSGITVAAYNMDGTLRGSTRTNSAGQFRLTLPGGSYRLAAFDNALHYATRFYSGAEQFESATVVSVAAPQSVSSLDFFLARGGVFSGTVRDAASGIPLAGRTVQLYAQDGTRKGSAVTSALGTYSIVEQAGSYKIVATDPGGLYRTVYYPGAPSFAGAPAIPLAVDKVVGGIDFALTSSSASNPNELFVVAAASGAGANGTFFRTDLYVLNPSALLPAAVELTWLPSGGGDNSTQSPTLRQVAPGSQLVITDAVSSLFGAGGGGAIRIVSNLPLVVASRTATPAPGGVSGGFGLGIPGVSRSRAVQSGRLTGITVDSSFRANVGFLNPSSVPVTINLVLSGPDGTLLSTGSVTLAPLGHFQASTIISFLGLPGPLRNASLRVSAPLPFFAYATLIDQLSGDASFFGVDPD